MEILVCYKKARKGSSETYIKHSNDMNNFYSSIEGYNSRRKRKVLKAAFQKIFGM